MLPRSDVVTGHPRTAVTASRILQGVSSFGFAAAAVGGVTAASVTLAVGGMVGIVGAVAAGSMGSLPRLLVNRTVVAVSVAGAASLVLAAQAFQQAAVATVAFLLLLVPVFAGLLAPLFRERLERRDLVGLGLGVVGIVCFAQPSPVFASEWSGILLALLAALALGVVWHQSKSLATHDFEPWATSAAQMIVPASLGLAAVLLLGWLPSGASLVWLIVSGVGYTGNTVLRLVGLRYLPASRAALLAPVSALTSTFLALLLLGQVPDPLTCLGAGIIVVGVLVAQWPRPGVSQAWNPPQPMSE